MSKFYNNVKVRLNRKGIKGIPKTEYLAAAEHLGINDLNNVTSEQIIAGVDYLMNKSSTELATVPANDLGITQVEVVEQPEETEHSAATSEAITLDDEEDLEDLAHETTEPEPQQSIEKADLPTFTYEEDSEATALAFPEKSELVASTAHNMGIVLDTQEIESIAENINYSADSLDEYINEIQAAITAFIEHKAQIAQQKIDNMVTEVRETVQRRNAQNSQRLTTGLHSINQEIKQANSDFKSSVRTALKAFALPPSKAQ